MTRAAAADAPTGPFAAARAEWLAGLALVRRGRTLAILFLFLAITGVGEGAMGALFAPFVTTILGGGGVAYGAVMAAQAIGGLLGSAAIGRLGRDVPPAQPLGLGAIGLGAIDLLIFNAHRVVPGLWPPLLLMAVVGLPAAGIGVGATALLQLAVADEFRGRVFGASGMVGGVSLLIGAALGEALGDPLGIVAVLNLQGCAYFAGGALVLALLARPAARAAGRFLPGR